MIDIVLPLAAETNKTAEDVRYCLRSIAKYVTGYNDIYIIGHERKWIKGVKWIAPHKNEAIGRQKRIFDKIIQACLHKDVSDRFAAWNDDYFFIKPFDLSEIKYWRQGNLKQLMAMCQGTYQRRVNNTFKFLTDEGLPIFHYDIHMPILYDRFRFLELEKLDWSKDYVIKSLYCNLFMVRGEEFSELNFKFDGRFPPTRESILKGIEGRFMFSVSENPNEAMRGVMGELFPEMSRFELREVEV